MVKYLAEFFGTALLVLFGNGVIANVHLAKSKGYHEGWIVIATGWGLAVGIPVVMFGGISGGHFNPAFTLGLAVAGKFPWSEVFPYILSQLIGAFIGGVAVWLIYKPFMDITEDKTDVLACFVSVPAIKNKLNSFIAEFFETYVLVFGALGIVNSKMAPGLSAVVVGFLVWALVLCLGGPTGPALNPARDLMPRIAHNILPIKGKRDSDWSYAWIPVIAPLLGSILGVYTYFAIFAR